MSDRAPTRRFSDRADAYAAHRPAYPLAAVRAVLDGLGDPAMREDAGERAAIEVVEVGAGTGIASRLFAACGARVIAVEPNAAMRANASPQERVTWRDGTAEATGLEAASCDVAVAAQAFHWFDAPAAMAEFRRIARFRAALLQYERDERDAFTAAYGACVRLHATEAVEARRARALEVFAAFPNARVRRLVFDSQQSLDVAGLLGRAASSSYLPAAGPPAEALQRDLRALFERYQCDGRVALAMRTFVITADWPEAGVRTSRTAP